MFKKIQSEIKQAMKDKNVNKRDVLKMVSSKAQLDAKEKKMEVTDEIVIAAIRKELKQLNQTKDSIANMIDSDLYMSTVEKIQILTDFLPKQMDKEEVEKAVKDILDKTETPNFGLMMKAVMSELKGKADSKMITDIVKSYKQKGL